MSALVVEGLCAAHGSKQVLDDVDLRVAPGTLTAVLGASGCGKTTLLRVIAGLTPATAGRIAIGERELSDPTHRVPTAQRGVGLVFQEYALFPDLDVAANVGFAPRAEASHVDELLELTGLSSLRKRLPRQLSGGQQQRVALARALAARPEVLLLDEPFANLDPALRGQLGLDLARLLQGQGVAAVLVTHDRTDALGLADEVVVLLPGPSGGQVAATGAPRHLWAAPPSPAVAHVVSTGAELRGTVEGGELSTAAGAVPTTEADGVAKAWVRPDQAHFAPGEGTHEVIAARFVGPHFEVEVDLGQERLWATAHHRPALGERGQVRLLGSVWCFGA